MRTMVPLLAALALLGCSSAPSEAASSAAPAPAPAGPSAASEAVAEGGGPAAPKAPSFGPGAGAIFTGNRINREPHGGLQALASWDAGTRESARGAACAEDSLELSQGAVFLSCTKTPVGGPKTGWTKIEMTGKTGTIWEFRYVHWPSVGTQSIEGTGVWTPDGEKSTLTYTRSDTVSGKENREPWGPALREWPAGETGPRPDGERPEPPPEDAPSGEVTPALPAETEPSPPPKNEPLAPEPTEEPAASPGIEDQPTETE